MRKSKLTAEEWFISKVRVNKKTKCHEWTGAISKNPPRARIPPTQQKRYELESGLASRSAFALFRPKEFDKDLFVLHTSDCRAETAYLCVNPDHLYQGSLKMNAYDGLRYGLKPSGEDCSFARLTNKQAKKAKELYSKGVLIKDIMKVLGFTTEYLTDKVVYHRDWCLIKHAIDGWQWLDKKERK